jgi:predicted peroxiredoxin
MTPRRVWEARTPGELIDDVLLGSWFGPGDVIQRIEWVQAGQVGTRIRIGYQLRVQNAGGTFASSSRRSPISPAARSPGCACFAPAASPSPEPATLRPLTAPRSRGQPGHSTGRKTIMTGKAVISLTTGLEDPEKVTVAFLVAIGAAESGRPTLMFQAKEAVRLALESAATGVACDGCPPLPDLLRRYQQAGGRYMVCPVCFNAKQLDKGSLLPNAELAGTVQLWEWIGDQAATTFSY